MANWWQSVRKIITFPSRKAITPVTVLARTLEKANRGRIKSVYIAIQWDENHDSTEGGFGADWSNMSGSDILCHKAYMDEIARRIFLGLPHDPDSMPTGKGVA